MVGYGRIEEVKILLRGFYGRCGTTEKAETGKVGREERERQRVKERVEVIVGAMKPSGLTHRNHQ